MMAKNTPMDSQGFQKGAICQSSMNESQPTHTPKITKGRVQQKKPKTSDFV